MNSPFWSLVMRYFLEFFSMVPCTVLCFLPVQDRLRIKPLNIFLTGIPLSILWAFAGGLVCADFGIARDFWILPSFILFAVFFLRVCDLAPWKPFSILIAVCAAGGLWLFAAVLFPLLLPLFIGLAVAAMARRPVRALERRTKLPRGLAAFLCVLGSTRWRGRGFFFLCRLCAGRSAGFYISCRSWPGGWKGPQRPCRTDSTPSRTNFRTAWVPVFARTYELF